MIRESFDYTAYLEVKRAIDDDSLNPQVWSALSNWLAEQSQRPLRILEIGAGVGTMIERLLNASILERGRYTAVELEAPFQAVAFRRLQTWSARHGTHCSIDSPSRCFIKGQQHDLSIDWLSVDILRLPEILASERFDLLIGHAVVDLLPVPECLPGLLKLLRPGGGFYFSLNFAGKTEFTPMDPRDEAVIAAYHRDMDQRFPHLDWKPSETGLRLGQWLTRQGYSVVATGHSDWQLPVKNLRNEDNTLFISNIIDTIAMALQGLPGLEEWLAGRRSQLADGNISFSASNSDLFGTVS